MRIVSTLKELAQLLSECTKNKSLGLIPTMGALHTGHIALVKKAIDENDLSICSIFVNPTQFNNPSDLEKYPNPLEKDLFLLEQVGCDFVFTPTKEEVYPEGFVSKDFVFGTLDKGMEGANRPGHFKGVAMVVSRLFDLIKPQKAYFGEKDFQQLAIIQSMVKQAPFPVEIVPCSIVREASGLAMSSRNMRLNKLQLTAAPRVYQRLFKASKMCSSHSIFEIKTWLKNEFKNDVDLDLEYFEISNPTTLQATTNWSESGRHIACIAVFAGEIRLIDNIMLEIN
ncbi:MAG: pantoate--beta-alanine ligase [Flavobacteriales bacterium]